MKLEDLHPYVVPYVPDMPTPTVEHHLRIAARDFLRRTHAWQFAADPIAVVADQTEYEIDTPAGVEVAKVLEVLVDDHDYAQACDYSEEVGGLVFQADDLPPPGTAMTVKLALAPAVGVVTANWSIPDALNEYALDISHGALGSLFLMVPGRVEDATRQMLMFNGRINTVGIKVSRGRTRRRPGGNTAAKWF